MLKLVLFFIVSCFSSFTVYNVSDVKNEEVVVINPVDIVVNIPKINFVGNIYPKYSDLNDIDKNIVIMNDSSYPDENGGIVIIGGHSGIGKYAYFKDLNKVNYGDYVYLAYKGINYSYQVIGKYLDMKDGKIDISNYNSRNYLYLYTCNPGDKGNYLVILAELKNDNN